jgi:hypothetical protein
MHGVGLDSSDEFLIGEQLRPPVRRLRTEFALVAKLLGIGNLSLDRIGCVPYQVIDFLASTT